MLAKKQRQVWGLGGAGLVMMMLGTACPGYLEEQAWLADGGIRSMSYAPPPPDAPAAPAPAPVTPGTGGAPAAAPPPGTGGTPPAAPPAAPPDAGTGAGGAPPAATPPAVRACATAGEISSKILMPKCSRCHSAERAMGGLDLASAGAKARLLNVMAKCAGKTLVVSDPVAGGHFFDKLAGPVANCGQRMPQGGMPLSADEIDCLKEWIKPPAAPAPAAPPAAPPACSEPAEVLNKILVPKCGNCHGVKVPAQGLDLVTPGAKARLVGKVSACGGKILITPDGEVGGHFFDKLAGQIPGCGNQMPYGGIAPLTPAETQCLKDWIRPSVQ